MPIAISGKDLAELLLKDGWQIERRANHGFLMWKVFPGESGRRTTIIPDKSTDLADKILGVILGVKQTQIGRKGLQELIDRYGK